MALLIAKAHHLVLDGRAIARAAALNYAGIHRRAINAAANDGVSIGVGEGEVAGNLGLIDARGAEREGRWGIVAGLKFEAGVIDSAAVKARTGAGLEAADVETQ